MRLRILLTLLFISVSIYSQPASRQKLPPLYSMDGPAERKVGIFHVNNQEFLEGLGLKKSNVRYSSLETIQSLDDFSKLELKFKKIFQEASNSGQTLPKKILIRQEEGKKYFTDTEVEKLRQLFSLYGIKLKLNTVKINWKERLNNSVLAYKKELSMKNPEHLELINTITSNLKRLAMNVDKNIYKKIYKRHHETPTKQETVGGFSKMAVTLVGMATLLPSSKGITPDTWVFWAIGTLNVITEISIGIYGKSYMNFLNNNKISRNTKIGVGAVATIIGFGLFIPYQAIQMAGGYVDSFFSSEFTWTYSIMFTVGLFASYFSLGVEKLLSKRWVKRSTGVNIIQAIDSFMGIEGILATGVDGSSPKSSLYTWVVFGIHNGIKIISTLIGLVLPQRRFKPEFIIIPMNDRGISSPTSKIKFSNLAPEKDFFKSYEGFYDFLLNKNYTNTEKIEFLNYVNYFLNNRKDLKIIKANKSYDNMIRNIIRATYNSTRVIKDQNYLDAISEVTSKFPKDYKSPLELLGNVSNADGINKVLKRIIAFGCY